ncbi:MAG: MopE-related protein, partial [Persicimonas sp.]
DSSGCPEEFTDCDGQCVDLDSDPDHCGRCGNRCEEDTPNTVGRCEAGGCVSDCADGWVDADEDPDNGCELECEISNGGVEICDGVDNDCDGEVDEDDADDAPTWYGDADGDGFGDPADTVRACEAPAGYVEDGTDCDDDASDLHTVIEVYRDADGDGWTRGDAVEKCTDGTPPDGFVEDQHAEDCDDTNPDVNPGLDELCGDGVDNDCDGDIDEDSAVDASIWYVDCDGDGFAADPNGSRTRCEAPANPPSGCTTSDAGWTDTRPAGSSSTDCNDEVADAFPGQDAWFDTPMNNDPAYATDEDWDYNCNGTADFRWTNTDAQCEADADGFACNGDAGWVFTHAFGCGSTGDYQKCKSEYQCTGICPMTCNDDIVQRTQECR